MFAEFITFEDSQNSIEKQLYAYMANVKQLECPQHGTFKGYSLKNCPQCIAEYRQGEINRSKDDFVLKKKIELGVGERYHNSTFDNYVINNEQQKNILAQLKTFNGGKNLIFSGNKGSGKSHLAIAVIDRLLRSGKSCMYIKFYNLIKLSFKDTQIMHKIINADFLVIDELGVNTILANEKEIIKNRLFEIIDQRWDRIKYTALISNMNMNEIKENISETTYSRLKENCLSFNFNWEDYRLNKEK